MVQELRREHLDPSFGPQTDDLQLATRFYHLRRQHTADPVRSAELARVFANIVEGDLRLAGLRLKQIESGRQAAADGGELLQGQTTTNLTAGGVCPNPVTAGTNQIRFGAPITERHAHVELGVTGSTP